MKAYQKPVTDIVNIKQTLMVASNPYTGNVESGFSLDATVGTDETSGNLSRHISVWDDEEEE